MTWDQERRGAPEGRQVGVRVMETLLFARMTPELLAKLDGYDGVSKHRHETMTRGMEAPCEYVASRATFFGFALLRRLFCFPDTLRRSDLFS